MPPESAWIELRQTEKDAVYPYLVNDIIRIAVVIPSTHDEVYRVSYDDPSNFSSWFVQDETKVVLT
jgi:hypothetical protein